MRCSGKAYVSRVSQITSSLVWPERTEIKEVDTLKIGKPLANTVPGAFT